MIKNKYYIKYILEFYFYFMRVLIMNKKITNKIVLIIITFLILSSSLFAPIYPDAFKLSSKEEFLLGVIILIVKIVLTAPIWIPIVIVIIVMNSINAKNGYGYTALIDASKNGDLEKVKLLIENGANIEVKDNNGDTALILASYYRYLEIIQYLVEKGANINATNDNGWTSLMYASKYGELETIKYLLENGADVNIKNKNGNAALDLAKIEDIKEVLRKAGAK